MIFASLKFAVALIGLLFTSVAYCVQESNNTLVDIERGIKVYPVKTELIPSGQPISQTSKTGSELLLASFDGLGQYDTEWSGPSSGLVRNYHHKGHTAARNNFRFKFHKGRVRLSDSGPSLEKMKVFAHKDLVEGVYNHAEIMFGREFVSSRARDAMDACGELLFEDHDPGRGGEFYLKLGFGEEVRRQSWRQFNQCKLSVVSIEEKDRLLRMVSMIPSMLSSLKCSDEFSQDRKSYPEDLVAWLNGSNESICNELREPEGLKDKREAACDDPVFAKMMGANCDVVENN